MLNIFINTALSCTPSGGFGDHLAVLQTPITPDGSLNATASQEGLVSGSQAKFTYTIAGHFEAATATTPASAAGTWREDIALASGTQTSCTSNDQSWSATLSREPAQQKPLVEPGDYSGPSGQGGGYISFSVAPGGGSLLNISINTAVTCTPSGGFGDHLGMLQVPISSGGSFAAQTSQHGVINGVDAAFTYSFDGYFEGPTPNGAATVAGIWRENIVFASGATKSCTSDDQSWTAAIKS